MLIIRAIYAISAAKAGVHMPIDARQEGSQEAQQDQSPQDNNVQEQPSLIQAQAPQVEPLILGSELPASDETQTGDQTESEVAAGVTLEQAPLTEPLDVEAISPQHSTVPLADQGEVPPVPALDIKTIVGDRYRIEDVVGVLHGTNLYRVTDVQGYRTCWACGSTASMEGDTYCVECGAQLTGRFYRLQEFNVSLTGPGPDGSPEVMPPLPEPILENEVEGIARVYDVFLHPDLGRVYIVWEEVYGRSLASWLEAEIALLSSPKTASGHLIEIEDPQEEQILGWMAQSAELLAGIHARGITGCDIGANNLVVQPGDRITLVDPWACTLQSPIEPDVQTSDVQKLATQLERWYNAVYAGDQGSGIRDQGLDVSDSVSDGQTQRMVSSIDGVVGFLDSTHGPAQILAKAREGAYSTAKEFAQALYDLYEENKPLTNLELRSGHVSDIGRVRQINEDSLLTLEVNILEHEGDFSVGLYVIADGMGGHQSGEVASSIAVRTVGSVINSGLLGPLAAGDPVATDQTTCADLLQHAVLEANRRIHELATERHSDLGTTITMALIVGNQLYVANVGDSRTYLWREEQLTAITRDHSLVAQLVAAGQLTQDEIYTHPRRNEIYRALGDPHLTNEEIDVFIHRLQPGDSVLLCSDGLWDFVRDPTINTIITTSQYQSKDPRSVCQLLVDTANEAGGEDNISTILVRTLGE